MDISSLDSIGFFPFASSSTVTKCIGFNPSLAPKIALGASITPKVVPYCDSRSEKGATCYGLVSGMVHVPTKCICNSLNALRFRHLKDAPFCSSKFDLAVPYFEQFYSLVLDEYMRRIIPMTDEWITRWPLPKQENIQSSMWIDPMRPNKIQAFLKREVYHNVIKKCRLIQGYKNLRTQAAFAPIFATLQKSFASVFDGSLVVDGISVAFASGMTVNQLGEWMDRAKTRKSVFYERDGANWDSCMQRQHMRLKELFFKIGGVDFLKFVKDCENISGSIRTPEFNVFYKVKGTTKSGHNDTSLGNSIINAGIAIEVMKRMGLTGHILVAGDDLLIAMDRDFDSIVFAQYEAECGISPEYKKFYNWSSVSFISGVWYPRPDGTTFFGPKPGRLFKRLFWSVKDIPQKKVDIFKHSICHSLLLTTREIPVLSVFLESNDPGGQVTMTLEHSYEKYELVRGASREELIIFFSSKYGLLASEITDCEEFLRHNSGKVGLVTHPTLEVMSKYDLCEVVDRPEVKYC